MIVLRQQVVPSSVLCLAFCIALLTSVTVPFLLEWTGADTIPIEYSAFLVCVVLWALGIALYRVTYGEIDWLAPPILWGGLYVLSSLSRLFIGYSVYQENVKPYVFLVVTGFIGLLLGFYLNVGRRRRLEERSVLSLRRIPGTKSATRLVAAVMLGGWALMGFVKLRSFGTYAGGAYGHGQLVHGPAYYATIAAGLLFIPSVVIYYCLAAYRRQRTPLLAVLFIFTYVFFRASSGDRTSGLQAVLGGLMAHNYVFRRLSLRRLLLGGIVVVTFVVAIWAYRINNFSLDMAAHELSVLAPGDVATICLTDVGSPVSVGTNVIRWFPEKHGWLYGRSYLDAVLNLIPGFFYGGSFHRPFIIAGYLYKDMIEAGRFNPNKTYGFSPTAEAFINFGYCGPFFVFAVLGYLLGTFHDHAVRAPDAQKDWYVVLYLLVYLPLFMALRVDCSGVVKQVVYNFAILAGMLITWHGAAVQKGGYTL